MRDKTLIVKESFLIILENLISAIIMVIYIDKLPKMILYINGILGFSMVLYLIIKHWKGYIPSKIIFLQAMVVIAQLFLIYILEEFTKIHLVNVAGQSQMGVPFAILIYIVVDIFTMVEMTGYNTIKYIYNFFKEYEEEKHKKENK